MSSQQPKQNFEKKKTFKRFFENIEQNTILVNEQFGLRNCLSTQHQLRHVTDKKQIRMVHLDLEKTVDTILQTYQLYHITI